MDEDVSLAFTCARFVIAAAVVLVACSEADSSGRDAFTDASATGGSGSSAGHGGDRMLDAGASGASAGDASTASGGTGAVGDSLEASASSGTGGTNGTGGAGGAGGTSGSSADASCAGDTCWGDPACALIHGEWVPGTNPSEAGDGGCPFPCGPFACERDREACVGPSGGPFQPPDDATSADYACVALPAGCVDASCDCHAAEGGWGFGVAGCWESSSGAVRVLLAEP